ncbi:acyl-CoA dehydrogenase family protein [Aquabacter sp. CN5-332]|uniref:acyl-CoA dehydrogenase family protein n=1 Tax=Aquabacter sp. CN5-332 TaxID=3156608 RepID=UPI0032B3EBE5
MTSPADLIICGAGGILRRRDRRFPASFEAADIASTLVFASENAGSLDRSGSFPEKELSQLVAIGAGLSLGSSGADANPSDISVLRNLLSSIGYASLPVGRLFEGHVNALILIGRYGTTEQARVAASDAVEGSIFGVWNTEGANGLRLCPADGGDFLEGAKTFASGAGFIARPLVTARLPDGESQMVLPRIPPKELSSRADLLDWTATGMRASVTGTFDFSGLKVLEGDLIGKAGDYQRQPTFSAGAWRFLAVQLGGMERLFDEACAHLKGIGRHEDPHQLARMGEAAIAVESARLWVSQASERAEISRDEGAVAYVNLARCAVERAGLDVLEHVNRSVGLAGFLAPHPVERVSRDLATYLRQPGPDRALTEGARYVLVNKRLSPDPRS